MSNHCRLLLYSCFSFLLCYGANGQGKKVPEPENLYVVHYLDAASDSLISLERQPVSAKEKGKLLGFSFRIVEEVKGEHSSVRLRADRQTDFVVNLPWGVEPLKIRLYRFEVKNGKRQLVFGARPSLQMDISRLGESSYILRPARPLLPGEYVFLVEGLEEIFCFGLDG